MASRLVLQQASSRSVFVAQSVAAQASLPKAAKASASGFKGAVASNAPLAFANQKRTYAAKSYFQTVDADANTYIPPDNSNYKIKNYNEDNSRTFAYFVVGSLSLVGAATAKNIITDYLYHFAASADVLAMAKVEVDMAAIPEGKNLIIKWRGKPIFVRHRTSEEIQEANSVSLAELRHKESDLDRAPKQDWLVMLGVCTHLGCVPIGEAGDYNGWFCPCHGSHYDISGRIRKGPAPLNLEIPPYTFTENNSILIG
ncbi:ubiquinol-cytochrome c reductase iron-sulfur subunit precursor [Polychytrium aggregatum]|uniref:ubiquinol-cytochrome c reductase iron-sulfur subunit precursor n=1 Tax=Polychytrium aggregatum TaxID=110093 RepID=UPI0022FE0BEA|nr:ubiquinol-cytochrome c reductase iron-sulfur subunit precursor [Polychytrium aggregatum]KAI9209522.1 ubiquinol-cytochrome c reductase iron-sulfur subunit precursor [Polychytrium aggregatum]